MYLNCHTYYSLKYGTLSPKELVDAAQLRGIDTLVLTDINNTSATLPFVRLCQKAGIKPVVGIEFREKNEWLFTGIALNNQGFRQLNELLTEHSMRQKPLPRCPPEMPDVIVVYPRLVKPMKEFTRHEFLGIRAEHVNRLYFSEVKNWQHKLLALNPITFLDKVGYQTHQLLRAIDGNTLASKLTKKDIAKPSEHFINQQVLEKFYEGFPRIIHNTKRLLAACTIDFTTGLHLNRQTFTGSKEGDFKLLEKLTRNGLKQRYDELSADYQKGLKRTEKELKVIREQHFCPYFLITWDIVRYAHSVGYYHVGRGSGANSLVAFCLFITDVDPLELDLYFERFINAHRTSPPDFDIDFAWNERDDVTDYIFKRYGKAHTALLATYNTFKGKSCIREIGKVFGLPKAEIDKIINHPADTNNHHELAPKIQQYAQKIEGFPNYLSIHAGGILITEQPLSDYTALQLMPKGFPITHFDMHDAEDWGFHKYDVLSQRGLGHIKEAVQLVKANQGRAVDIHAIKQIMLDPKVRRQLKSGDCIGCFYIESPAMRGLLKKLRCDDYRHLVAASSIIRPGVAKSGMMREYIHRFHHPHRFKYLHPVFEEQLADTYGVMVYQEDTMKIIHHFAGLGLGESDVLRRMMTGKRNKGDSFELLRQKYFDNCAQRGYTLELAQEVWRQIESFAGYSFCKAHSASFAVESFQSLYLKTYFPLEFMVAVINNFGGFYQTEYYFRAAQKQGAKVHAPGVNRSHYSTHIEGTDIYIGFVHLHQMERKVASALIQQRQRDGHYRNLADFVNRVPISTDQLELLIRIGAFRFTGKSKAELMWEKNAVFNPKKDWEISGNLFDDPLEQFQLPNLERGRFDQAFDEIELLGFCLRSPFDLLKCTNFSNTITVGQLANYLHRRVTILAYYVCRKRVRTVNQQQMAFGTWLDRTGQFLDTTHFPDSLKRFPFRGKGIYKIYGKVAMEFDFYSLEVERMELLPLVGDERYG
ncbi:MAG: DNA polymerase III subunit alpha [Bacteroidota bacterium]